MSLQSTRLPALAVQVAFFATVLTCVYGLSRLSPLMPSPTQLALALSELLQGGELYTHIATTLTEAFVGLAIAAILGIVIGLLMGSSRNATEFLNPIVLSLYSVPKIIFLPMLLIIFGPGISAKIANAAIHALFPILLNTMVGMRELDRLHLRVARSMFATPFQLVTKVYAPSMVLPVLTGVRLGTGLAFMGALLAELFEAKAGIGYFVNQLYAKGLIAEMLATVFVMFVLILIINAVLKTVEDGASKWRRR